MASVVLVSLSVARISVGAYLEPRVMGRGSSTSLRSASFSRCRSGARSGACRVRSSLCRWRPASSLCSRNSEGHGPLPLCCRPAAAS